MVIAAMVFEVKMHVEQVSDAVVLETRALEVVAKELGLGG
jgi:hypothetical protein